MNKSLTWGAIILGIVFVIISITYFITPANSLPGLLPGFDASMTKIHYKHGIAALILALGLFAFAWFKSGSAQPADSTSDAQTPMSTQ